MGWFRRRHDDVPTASPEVIVVDSAELATVRRLLADYESAQTARSDSRACEAIRAISRAGSSPDGPAHATSEGDFGVRMTRSYMRTGDVGFARVWRWLVAVARSAERRGDADLVAHIVFFAAHWLHIIGPLLTMADEQHIRLAGGIPDDSRRELFDLGRRALRALPPDHVVVYDPDHVQETMTVDMVRDLCDLAEGTRA